MLVCGMLLSGAAELRAQQFLDADFGRIPDSLYALRPPADDSETPYMITNKEVDVSFRETAGSIVAILEHHIRIKVFDESAPEASIVAIPYYFDESMEQISDIRGLTHLPSGKQVPLRQGDIRTVNINSRYNVKEFTMPSVTDGAILEYRYTIRRRYIEELPEFFLSHKVPTAAAKMTITYPEYLRYESYVENFDSGIQHDFVYTDTSSVPKIFTVPQPEPVVTERWMAYDISPTKPETFITTLDDYRAKIKFMMKEFGIPRQVLDSNWEVTVAKMRRKTNPLAEIRRNALARAKGDSIARAYPSASKEAVQDSIFQHLNEAANFSGEYRAYSTVGDSLVLDGRPVDQAAINQVLIGMLQGAGIQADPVLVSSRESGRVNRDFPSYYQFNGQLARSKIGGRTYLMDASYAHSQPGLIPVAMYNGPGLLFGEEDFDWVDINPEKSRFEINVKLDADLDAEGRLTGTVASTQRGFPVRQMRQQKADGMSESEMVRRALFDGYANARLRDVEIEGLESYGSPVRLTARFEIPKYATSFSNGLEYRPMVVGYRSENPFRDKNRNYPITLDAPETLSLSYSITLPQGYQVDRGSANQSIRFEGASFEESYDLGNGELNYDFTIDLRRHQFPAELFPRLNALYERWVTISNGSWLIRNRTP